MDVGLALPQYDFSVPGESPLRWETLLGWAERAEALGFGSVWLSDHLFLDISRYGAPPGDHGCFDPIVALAAIARRTRSVRLGTLTLCTPLRPATVLAKALATLDVLSGGRLVVGLEAVEEGPEEGAARLAEAVEVLRGMWGGGPYRFEGRHQRAVDARCLPRPVQQPAPPVWLRGTGDRLLDVVARLADGWATAWPGSAAAYREQVAALYTACEDVGRNPASVALSVEVPAPAGTVDQVREQLGRWAALGVSTVVIGAGAVPFASGDPDDLLALAAACSLEPCRTSDPWN